MSAPPQPYDDRERTFDAYGRHVNAGKTAMYRQLGLEFVMGEREGARSGSHAEACIPRLAHSSSDPLFMK